MTTHGLKLIAMYLVVLPLSALAVGKGDQAPEIELQGDDGIVKILKKPGKIIYLDFWASWCGPCRQSFPWMNSMQEKYKDKNFQIIGVNLDAQHEDALAFLGKVPARFTIAYDHKGLSPQLYGVKGMPTSYVIGKDGTVLYQHSGFSNEGRDVLEQIIQTAVSEQK